jgi:formate dehydrogenase (NADP+) beta subunit
MPPKFSLEMNEATVFTSALEFQKRTSPCEASCPAGMPIQKMNGFIKENRLEEALQFIRSRNPFSSVTGRVCNRPCETGCNRNEYDEGLSIRGLERHCSDHADRTGLSRPRKKEGTGKKVAVVGAGPAGMTCAWFSALFGHQVTVFEAAPSLGGMPRIGIPDFRLPKHVVDREIGQILALGIEARTNTTVGKEVTLDAILSEYDVCLIAAGAWKERVLDLPGGEIALSGLTFLRQVNQGRRENPGRIVAVIGGGGVAFDCALTAKRLGAKEVHVICVEGPSEMCATAEDIAQAKEEGIVIHNRSTVSRITGKKSGVSAVEISPISGFHFDESGRLTVETGSGPGKTLNAETVISAIGLEPDLSAIDPDRRLKTTQRKTLDVHPLTMATSIDRVYAAGDIVTGPGSVAQAVGSGRLAAVAINNRLMGLKPDLGIRIVVNGQGKLAIEENPCKTEPHVVKYEEMSNLDSFEKKPRFRSVRLPLSKATTSMEEMDKGLCGDDALAEAERCFHCGHCQLCGNCVEDCPGYVLAMTDSGPKVVYPEECWHCGNCRISCPSAAVSYEFPVSMLV